MFKRNVLTLASIAMISSATQAETVQFNRITAFGDSLSDAGTYSNTARAGLIAAGVNNAPAIQYRFTTNNPDGSSKVWAEVLARELGLSITPNRINPSLNGGNDYAEGGARVSQAQGIGYSLANGITTTPLSTQIDRFLTSNPNISSNDLILVWAGANDAFTQAAYVGAAAISPTTGLSNMTAEANNLITQVDRLKAAGAKYVVVAMLPDLANTPLGALYRTGGNAGLQASGLLTALSTTFNNTLKSNLPQKDIVVVDVNKLLSDVINNPTRYGFNTNALGTTACGVNPSATGVSDYYNSSLTCLSTNSSNYLFADSVHPSSKAHELFGVFAMSGLRAIAQSAALAVAPMVATRQHAQALESRLNIGALTDVHGQLRAIGDVQIFGGAESGWFNTKSQQIEPSVDASTQKYNIGADRMIAKNILVGGAFSYSNAQSNFGNNTGGFKTTDMIGVAFTTIALSKNAYVNASVAYGDIDHSSFTRLINLDTTTIAATSSPQGKYHSYRIGGGLNYEIANWKGGPYLSYTDEKTKIKGFDESNSPASLSFGDIEYHARRITLGFIAAETAPTNTWRPFARASIDKDLKKNDLVVPMGPDSTSLARVFVPRPDRTTWSTNIGMALPSSDRSVWTVMLGAGGASNQLIGKTAGVSYRLAY